MSEHKGSSFFNGFILGLLLGAGLVFLFGTNKGRKVLQMLLEQVEENTELSELLEIPEGEEEEYMEGLEEEMPEREEEPIHHQEEKPQAAKPSGVKRFFKGAKKVAS